MQSSKAVLHLATPSQPPPHRDARHCLCKPAVPFSACLSCLRTSGVEGGAHFARPDVLFLFEVFRMGQLRHSQLELCVSLAEHMHARRVEGGAQFARHDVPFLFKAFETGQMRPPRPGSKAALQPRASTIHEYLDWTFMAVEGADEDDLVRFVRCLPNCKVCSLHVLLPCMRLLPMPHWLLHRRPSAQGCSSKRLPCLAGAVGCLHRARATIQVVLAPVRGIRGGASKA